MKDLDKGTAYLPMKESNAPDGLERMLKARDELANNIQVLVKDFTTMIGLKVIDIDLLYTQLANGHVLYEVEVEVALP